MKIAPGFNSRRTDILRLPVSNSAISHAKVELTRQGVDVHINRRTAAEHAETNQGSRWVANGRGMSRLRLRGDGVSDDARASQALRLRGTITQLVGLGEDTHRSMRGEGEVCRVSPRTSLCNCPSNSPSIRLSGAMVPIGTLRIVTSRSVLSNRCKPVHGLQ